MSSLYGNEETLRASESQTVYPNTAADDGTFDVAMAKYDERHPHRASRWPLCTCSAETRRIFVIAVSFLIALLVARHWHGLEEVATPAGVSPEAWHRVQTLLQLEQQQQQQSLHAVEFSVQSGLTDEKDCSSDRQLNVTHIEDPKHDEIVANDSPLVIVFTTDMEVHNVGPRWNLHARCSTGQVQETSECVKTCSSPKECLVSVSRDFVSDCRGHDMDVTLTIHDSSASVHVKVASEELSLLYCVFSGASVVACALIIYLYMNYSVLRVFPSNLMFWRTVTDMLFNIMLIWINAWEINGGSRDEKCNPFIAFLTQFCLLASLSWYMCLSMSFYLSITNPFQKPQSLVSKYHWAVWSTACVTGIVVAFENDYRADFQLCWVPKTAGINPLNWAMYFTWLFAIFVASLFCLMRGLYKLNSHLMESTLDKRREALMQTRTYVLMFFVYWMVAAIVWFTVYKEASHENKLIQNPTLSSTFAIVAGMMGLVDSIGWLIIQRKHVRHILRTDLKHLCSWIPRRAPTAKEAEEAFKTAEPRENRQFEDISDALRFEYITNTSQGIKIAALTTGIHSQAGHSRDNSRSGRAVSLGAYNVGVDNIQLTPEPQRGELGSPLLQNDYHSIPSDENAELEKLVQDDLTRPIHIPLSDNEAKFKVFAPRAFQRLRSIFGASTNSFVRSVSGDVGLMKQNFSEGASGSFFYMTVDRKYLVKTLSVEEKEFLLSILPSYFKFMRENEGSFICRFYGLYSIRMYGNTVFFVVMNNFLRVSSRAKYRIDEIYDLKGSSIGRHTKPPPPGKVKTRKDNDLNYTVRVHADISRRIKEQLARDAFFMASLNIMDYSLLLGVANVETPFTYDFDTHSAGTGGAADEIKEGPALYVDVPGREASRSLNLRKGKANSSSANTPPKLGLSASRSSVVSMVGDQRLVSWLPHLRGIASDCVIGPGIYQFGIIDVLQQWNFNKWSEKWAKMIFRVHCFDWKDLSCIQPTLYRDRFVQMTERTFEEYSMSLHEDGDPHRGSLSIGPHLGAGLGPAGLRVGPSRQPSRQPSLKNIPLGDDADVDVDVDAEAGTRDSAAAVAPGSLSIPSLHSGSVDTAADAADQLSSSHHNFQ